MDYKKYPADFSDFRRNGLKKICGNQRNQREIESYKKNVQQIMQIYAEKEISNQGKNKKDQR